MTATASSLIRWQPTGSTLVAAASVLAMWCLYYFGSQAGGLTEILIFTIGIMLTLVGLICLYVRKVEHGNLASIGIHTRRLYPALGISLFLGANSLFYYFPLVQAQGGLAGDATYWLLWNMAMLWEVLFVYGWLQIRFERAFGTVLGIILATLSFVLYHVGSLPVDQLAGMGIIGLIGAVLFKALKNNIFVLWPLFWSVGGAISVVQAGTAAPYAAHISLGVVAAFVIQLAIVTKMLGRKSGT
jgi:hypothetical protein